MLDIISHIRQLISPNGIKTQGPAPYLIIKISMIKLPETIHKKYNFVQMDDLPQSSAFMKLLRSCLLAAVSLKLHFFACFKCFVITANFKRHTCVKRHILNYHIVLIRDVNLDFIFNILSTKYLNFNTINNRQFSFYQYHQIFSSS